MSSGGGGDGLIEEAKKGFKRSMEKLKEDSLRQFVRFSSGGILDPGELNTPEKFFKALENPFKKTKIGPPADIHMTDEWVGELNGRNKTRMANRETQKKISEELIQRKKDMDLQQLQAYRADKNASMMAEGLKNTAALRSRRKLGASSDEELLGV